MFEQTVYEKGQVVIPKPIRETLGLRPQSKVVFVVKNKQVILQKSQNMAEKFKKMATETIKDVDSDRIYEEEIEDRLRRLKINVP